MVVLLDLFLAVWCRSLDCQYVANAPLLVFRPVVNILSHFLVNVGFRELLQ